MVRSVASGTAFGAQSAEARTPTTSSMDRRSPTDATCNKFRCVQQQISSSPSLRSAYVYLRCQSMDPNRSMVAGVLAGRRATELLQPGGDLPDNRRPEGLIEARPAALIHRTLALHAVERRTVAGRESGEAVARGGSGEVEGPALPLAFEDDARARRVRAAARPREQQQQPVAPQPHVGHNHL